jgi:hypothetical protein
MKKTSVVRMVMAGVLVIMLMGMSAPQPVHAAQQLSVAQLARIRQLAGNGTEALDPAAAQCILQAAVAQLVTLYNCGDDATCKSKAVVSLVLDSLLCVNPDNKNLAFVECIVEPILELSELSTQCGGDRACLVQQGLPVVLQLVDCINTLQPANN